MPLIDDPPFELPVNLTGYWPFVSSLSAKERKMEGGVNDRKGHRLHTLQEHMSDPIAHPYVSLAGDYTIFKYGQRLIIPALGTPSEEWKQITGENYYIARVVDTGGHFFGPNKVIRHPGFEPIDVCVQDSHSWTTRQAYAHLVEGDTSREPIRGGQQEAATVADELEAATEDLTDSEDGEPSLLAQLFAFIESIFGGVP